MKMIDQMNGYTKQNQEYNDADHKQGKTQQRKERDRDTILNQEYNDADHK